MSENAANHDYQAAFPESAGSITSSKRIIVGEATIEFRSHTQLPTRPDYPVESNMQSSTALRYEHELGGVEQGPEHVFEGFSPLQMQFLCRRVTLPDEFLG